MKLPLALLLMACLSILGSRLDAAADANYGVDVPGRLYYVSVASGSDAGPGTANAPFRTISQAAALAMPGDAVLVDNGIYRERVAPPRGGVSGKPIIYKARPGLKVTISGANRWTPTWTPLRSGSPVRWAIPDPALFTDDCYWSSANPFKVAMSRTPSGRNGLPELQRGVAGADPTLVFTLGQLFIDGTRMEQVGSLAELERASSGWWYESASGRLYARFADGIDPAQRMVEITTRRRVFAPHLRGLGYIHVIGFVIERCGNQFPARFWESRDTVQAGALGTRAGHHWLIRGNVVRHANSIGIDIGGEGEDDGERLDQPRPQSAVICDNVVEENWVMDNGVSGIAGSHATRMIVRGNVVTGNNALRFSGPERYEQGGIKLHTAKDARIEGNLVKDNHAYGIYIDSGGSYQGLRISRNLIVDNLWAGMHIEQSNNPANAVLIDTNVVIGCGGAGIYVSGASGLTIVQNLLAGSRPADSLRGAGIYVLLTDTFDGLSDTGRIAIRGNLILDNSVALDLNYPTAVASQRALDANLYGTTTTARSFLINPYASEPRLTDSVLFAKVHGDLGTGSPGLTALSIPYRATLTFEESRRFWGAHVAENDDASRLDPAALVKLIDDSSLTVELTAALSSVTVPRPATLTTDFSGKILPAGSLRPGPWQGLPSGLNRLECWKGIAINPPFAVALSSSFLNTPPTLSAIADQEIPIGGRAGPLAFTIGDMQTTASSLKVTASSASLTLVPASGIVLGGSGSSRTITVTPAAGKTGQATITVVVSDGALRASKSLVVRVGTVTASDVDLAINFQPEGAPVPLNNLPDYGKTYANRGNGFSYGWSVDARSATRDRNASTSPDQRHDTLINFPSGGQKWEIGLPNGTYDVRIVCGDPSFSSGSYKFMFEGKTVVDGSPTAAARWLDVTYAITVSDGKLSLTQGTTAQLGKLCFIEITSRPPVGKG